MNGGGGDDWGGETICVCRQMKCVCVCREEGRGRLCWEGVRNGRGRAAARCTCVCVKYIHTEGRVQRVHDGDLSDE